MTDITEANRLYEAGNDHYRTAQEMVSKKQYQEAINHFILAAEQYESAVKLRNIFPEAYHNWANVMTRLIPLTGTTELAHQALEKYLTSGLQFIVNGTPQERPFEEALNLIAESDRYALVFRIYSAAVTYAKGKKSWNAHKDEKALLTEARTVLESPAILIDLIETLLKKRTEKLPLADGDDLISSATKVLINTLIDADS